MPRQIIGDSRSTENRLILKYNKLIIDKQKFEKEFIKKKKRAELELIAENKDKEFENKILAFTKTEYQRREKLERFEKLQKQSKMRAILDQVEFEINF